jgi:hypothetical protein
MRSVPVSSLTSRRWEHDYAMCEREGDPLMKARRTYEGRDEPPEPHDEDVVCAGYTPVAITAPVC